jgi:ParB family chromosome partitioning protein
MSNEQIQYLPLDKIVCEKQVREQLDEEGIRGLAARLKAAGQLQPIRVRKAGDRFVVIDGERRLLGAKIAGLQSIAAIVESKDLSEGEIVYKQLIANLHENLTPIERAKAIGRLMEVSGWTATQVAARLGMSDASVAKYLAILKLPEPILDAVHKGSIPFSGAYQLTSVDDPAKQADLAREMAQGRLTRDALQRRTRKPRQSNAQTVKAARVTCQLQSGVSVAVSGGTLSLDDVIESLAETLKEAKRARDEGLNAKTWQAVMRDRARKAG